MGGRVVKADVSEDGRRRKSLTQGEGGAGRLKEEEETGKS